MSRFPWRLLLVCSLLAGCRLVRALEPSSPTVATGAATSPTASFSSPPPPASSPLYPPPIPSSVSPSPANVLVSATAAISSPTPAVVPADCIPSAVPPEFGLVLWVIDGSTIEVDIQGKRYPVRYLGLQTPPLASTPQPLAIQAKAFNQSLVSDQVVALYRDVSNQDRFGQLLRYVLVGDAFINYQMVLAGHAVAASQAPDLSCQEVLIEAQRQAQLASAGMWAVTSLTPTPPGGIATPTLSPAVPAIFPSITPTPSSVPTTLPVLTSTVSGSLSPTPAGIYIETIHYLDTSASESGEYVQIRNGSTQPVNLEDWILEAGEEGILYPFPHFTIQPGMACRIYTKQLHFDTCGFNFNSPTPVWDNAGMCAYLYRQDGELVHQYCYP